MFFFIFPYRAKNPTAHFPFVTLALIIVNLIVFIFTQDHGIIREDIVDYYAFALGRTPGINFFTAIFLHGSVFHLVGNMAFLWVFGGAVEDRLGTIRYLFVYLGAGFAGDLLQAAVENSVLGFPVWGIGASGCIMGLMGAYGYLFSWSPISCAYFWWFIIRVGFGVFDVSAVYLVMFYFLSDVWAGFMFGTSGASDGVANLCHVGGLIFGVLLMMILRERRDNVKLSEAKAIQADMKDMSLLPLHALETMHEAEPKNIEVIRAMFEPAMRMNRTHVVASAMEDVGGELVEADPALVGYYVGEYGGDPKIYTPAELLRVAGYLERKANNLLAIKVYDVIIKSFEAVPEIETALYRQASCYFNRLREPEKAKAALMAMAQGYPNGPMFAYGKQLWNQIAAAPALTQTQRIN